MQSLVNIGQVVLGIFEFPQLFLLFCNYLPLEKGMTLHLNKFEYPFLKDALCQAWLKLAPWLCRRKILH